VATILIGGQDRPFHVGTNQGDIFCRLQGYTLAQYAATFSDISTLGLGAQRDFLYSALRAGAERAGQQVAFTATEVGDWMDEPDYEAGATLAPVIAALGAQFAAKAEYQKQRDAKNAGAPAMEPTSSDPNKMAIAS
jgi:hypothetical protein